MNQDRRDAVDRRQFLTAVGTAALIISGAAVIHPQEAWGHRALGNSEEFRKAYGTPGPAGGRGSRPEKEAPNNPFVDSFISFVCLDLIAAVPAQPNK
jgi:hypothetical protein